MTNSSDCESKKVRNEIHKLFDLSYQSINCFLTVLAKITRASMSIQESGIHISLGIVEPVIKKTVRPKPQERRTVVGVGTPTTSQERTSRNYCVGWYEGRSVGTSTTKQNRWIVGILLNFPSSVQSHNKISGHCFFVTVIFEGHQPAANDCGRISQIRKQLCSWLCT